jgi:hypothetical protein
MSGTLVSVVCVARVTGRVRQVVAISGAVGGIDLERDGK